jgi:AbiV family abortive infection protein
MKLELRKIQHLAGLSLKNGIRLHFDSIKLYKLKSYPTALFISVIAMEEIGKAFWADHFAFTTKINGRDEFDLEDEWINLLFGDHKKKQLSFLRQEFSKIDIKYYEYVQSRQLEKLKQDSLYVGLERPKKGNPRTDGKLINPLNIKKITAKEQILIVHTFLMSEIESEEKGSIYFDLATFRETLNSDLLVKLRAEKIK